MLYRHKLELSREQLNGMLDTAEEVLSYRKCYGYVGTEFPRCLIKDINKYRYLGIGTQCAAAKGFFAIDPSGQIRTCNHSPRIVGHVLEGGNDNRQCVLESVCSKRLSSGLLRELF